MKTILLVAGLLTFAADCTAAPAAIETTKSSEAKKFDPATEVKTFYRKLIESDQNVKEQFTALLKESKLFDPAHFSPAEPQVVDWFPLRDRWNVEEGFHHDERFLVIQPLEFGRGGQLDYDSAIVSEFRVIHDGTTQIDPKAPDAQPRLLNNKITVQFLGFRRFTLSPVNIRK